MRSRMKEDRGAVLQADVGALPIQRRRVSVAIAMYIGIVTTTGIGRLCRRPMSAALCRNGAAQREVVLAYGEDGQWGNIGPIIVLWRTEGRPLELLASSPPKAKPSCRSAPSALCRNGPLFRRGAQVTPGISVSQNRTNSARGDPVILGVLPFIIRWATVEWFWNIRQ